MSNLNNKYTSEGELIFKDGILFETVQKTKRGRELEHNNDWDPAEESWIEYRTRNCEARRKEELNRYEIARRIAAIYNTAESNAFQDNNNALTCRGNETGFL